MTNPQLLNTPRVCRGSQRLLLFLVGPLKLTSLNDKPRVPKHTQGLSSVTAAAAFPCQWRLALLNDKPRVLKDTQGLSSVIAAADFPCTWRLASLNDKPNVAKHTQGLLSVTAAAAFPLSVRTYIAK